jgi:acetoin utilization deacetylase AcuC-like enzyme
MHFVYHEKYDLNLGSHVFPSSKFRLIRQQLIREGEFTEHDILRPAPAPLEDLLLVHDRGWIQRLLGGTLKPMEELQLEIPWSRAMAEGFVLAAGGTTLAARTALEERVCYNAGGGFHHAFPAHGEGFCAIHDVAVAIRVLQREGKIERAMVIDCDVHHGNGTAAIFANDDSVFTISIQQLHNYPAVKPPSDIDIHLEDGTGDAEYLVRLEQAIKPALTRIRPQLVMYVAGADPYGDDQLGGLDLSMDGLRRRDELVIASALEVGAPVAITLAGGYARNVADTVEIHCQTARVARKLAMDSKARKEH